MLSLIKVIDFSTCSVGVKATNTFLLFFFFFLLQYKVSFTANDEWTDKAQVLSVHYLKGREETLNKAGDAQPYT